MYIVKKIMNVKATTLFTVFVLIFSFSVNVNAQKKKRARDLYLKYTEIKDPKTDSNLIPLEKGNDPQIIIWSSVSGYMANLKDLKEKGYLLIGSFFAHPVFNKKANKKYTLKEVKKVGATVILTTDLFLTSMFYAMQKVIPKAPAVVNTVTPNPTTTIAATANITANSGKSSKLGVSLRDLTLEERTDIERNKGAFIADVLEDTPAFESNVIPGDILIKISNFEVKNAAQAILLIDAVNTDEDLTITVFRKGSLKEITVKF